MSTWIALAAVAAGSYLLRFAPLVALERVRIPPTVERALSFAGPAAMAALAVSALLNDGHVSSSAGAAGATAAGLGIAGSLAFRRRPFLVAVGLGLAAFVLIDTTLT